VEDEQAPAKLQAWDIRDEVFSIVPGCWEFVLKRLPGAGLLYVWCDYEIPRCANSVMADQQ
jgi:hypothetical protein